MEPARGGCVALNWRCMGNPSETRARGWRGLVLVLFYFASNLFIWCVFCFFSFFNLYSRAIYV